MSELRQGIEDGTIKLSFIHSFIHSFIYCRLEKLYGESYKYTS